MLCKNIPLGEDHEGAYISTYIIDNSQEVDKNRHRPAVLICPGGGYFYTSDREAEFVALGFTAKGYHAFVLRYSVGAKAKMPGPLLEAYRAIAVIRSKVKEWYIDVNRIVVAGFSAGGHIAACAGTMWHLPEMAEAMHCPNENFRPNAMILGYAPLVWPCRSRPIKTMLPAIARKKLTDTLDSLYHPGPQFDYDQAIICKNGRLYLDSANIMQQLIMGKPDYTLEEVAAYSADRLVSEQTPPAFVWTTQTDAIIPPDDSVCFVRAMLEKGRRCELHLFSEGGHGISLATKETAGSHSNMANPDTAEWFPMAIRWLEKTFRKRIKKIG